MNSFDFKSSLFLDNGQNLGSMFPKKRLSFKAKKKLSSFSNRLSDLSPNVMSPAKSESNSQSPSKQTKLTDWMSPSNSKGTSSKSSPIKATSSPGKPSILSQFIESGERIVLSHQLKSSPQKFFKKSELSPSPKKKTPAKRKLDDEFEKSPSKLVAIDSYFKKLDSSQSMEQPLSRMEMLISEECIVVSDDSNSEKTELEKEKLDEIPTTSSNVDRPLHEGSESSSQNELLNSEKTDTGLGEEVPSNLDCWEDEPFQEIIETISSQSEQPVESLTLKEPIKQVSPTKSPKKYRTFEYLISYLTKNPMSDQATNDGILSHDAIVELIGKLEQLPCGAQMLYKRLYGRTKTWYRLKNDFSKYESMVEDISGALSVLEKGQLLCSDSSAIEVEVLLNLLLTNELKEICKSYKINLTSTNKGDMIQALLRYGNKQKSLSNISTMSRIRAKVVNALGTCYCLKEEPRRLFHILLVLSTFPYFRGEEKDRLSSLELNLTGLRMNTVRFPLYTVRPMQVFTSYSHLEQFAESIHMSAELFSLIEKKEKEEAADVVMKIKMKFVEYLENKENMEIMDHLKNYLVKFTAGQTYAYCLNKGVTMLKSTERYSEAEEVLHLLLEQTKFIAGARGQWYNELALIHETQFKNVPKAMEYVSQGLADEKVSLIDRTTLTQRGLKLLKRKNIKAPEGVKETLQSLIDNQINYKPPSVVITAIAMAGGPGKKQVFVKDTDDGKQMSSVEEYVVEYYKYDAPTTYQFGRHDEGSFLMNLVVALFFDIIYCQPLEDESFFLCPMQSKPLDWGSRGFYKRRKDLIDSLLVNLRAEGLPAIRGLLEDLCNKVYNTESLVNWQNLSVEKLDKICEILDCVGVDTFLNIAEHVIKDFKAYRSGFPDLILWDPPTKQSLFVEVKGPNDSLSITQTVWLKNLSDFGANAIVAHVETPGTTKRRSK